MKNKITIDFKGAEGNIYFIMARAAEVISNQETVEMASQVVKQKSYEDAIKVIEEYVEIERIGAK